MTRLRLRNLRSGNPTVGRGRFAGAVASWLAVLAILVQAIVPDVAMAARDADRQKAGIAAALIAAALDDVVPDQGPAPLRYSGCAPAADEQTPASRHPHEELCAFCIAQSMQGAATGAGIGLSVPLRYREAVAGDRPGIHPPRLFLVASKPRAPPDAARA